MFTSGYHYGGGSNYFTVHFFSEGSIQCAVMPTNYIYISVECLLSKCMTKASSEDCADQLFHFKYTSTPYIALLNARYYLQPNTDITASPKPHIEFGIHNLELPIRALQDNKLQTPGKRLFEEEVVHPTRPSHAVMVSSCFTFSKIRTYMTCPSNDSRLSPWWKWTLSCRREW